MKKTWVVLGCVLTLSGCDFLHEQRNIYIRDRANDYLTSELVPPIMVEPPLSYYNSEVFPLPDVVPDPGTLNNISIQPPGFGDALEA